MTWWRRSPMPSSSRPITPTRWCPWPKRPRPPGSRSSPMTRTWPIPPRVSGEPRDLHTGGGSARRRGGRTGRGERALRRREYRSGCVQPELLDRRHEGADAGEVPEDAAGRHPLWDGQTRGVVQRGQDLINKFRGQLDAIVAPTVVALPKVAEAVEQTGFTGKIVVTGLSTPNDMKEFVKRGTVKTVVLWNPVDLGYLAVYVAQASLAGTLKDNTMQAKVPAGRLGTRDAVASLEDITAKGPLTLKNVIVLGNPFRFTKDNIDQFDF